MRDRIALEAFLRKVESIKEEVDNLYRMLENDRKAGQGNIDVRPIKRLWELYEESRTWAVYNINEVGRHMPYVDDQYFYTDDKKRYERLYMELDIALMILREIRIGCDVVIGALNSILKPGIGPEIIDELKLLRQELEKLAEKGLDVILGRNIKYAIDELEHGHYLASAMISSRVIRYIIDKIPGRTDEDKIKYLVQRGLIPKDRRDEERSLLTALRISRNFLSHRVDMLPEVEDALMLLSGTFKLSRVFMKLEEVSK
ncbi:MAG: hypothetical protein ACTSXX_04240 [Candidatus Baldrarchaeia archaeon]